ncbi:hypothetical protein CA223_07010 [Sphingomonas koreensis]|jgi:hypothetical protein|uniref:DUF4148 domain-containing protein n=1 Tax=Sphingomonas koreensis TaxID=93064 RepID=A0A1L6J7S2_9SPHN|nr:hypothetical protein [Sphingomonas koreensis]APR51958.1 hypothetical protein BRX40_05470 [Sphingomonas koreensis]MDC7812419.1 hypothetical protein [Sphingomonas koreensis]PJI88549.1 hypothetical protein BDW16_1833 [Sphingomonas koreensis]RSU22760.1 hypothetical protein CA224_05090 [Sphingomonas koreensis]RSU30765.1 hypothetical protein CA222_01455 [Sphingomonas koreensis]
MRIALLAAIAALSAPATAQIRDPSGGVRWPAPRPALPGVARELGQADRNIREGRESGQLSRREARQLRRESRQIAVLEERYARGGLSESERAELESRVAALRSVTGAKRSGKR